MNHQRPPISGLLGTKITRRVSSQANLLSPTSSELINASRFQNHSCGEKGASRIRAARLMPSLAMAAVLWQLQLAVGKPRPH